MVSKLLCSRKREQEINREREKMIFGICFPTLADCWISLLGPLVQWQSFLEIPSQTNSEVMLDQRPGKPSYKMRITQHRPKGQMLSKDIIHSSTFLQLLQVMKSIIRFNFNYRFWRRRVLHITWGVSVKMLETFQPFISSFFLKFSL